MRYGIVFRYHYHTGKCGCIEEDSLVVGRADFLIWSKATDRELPIHSVFRNNEPKCIYTMDANAHNIKGRKRKENVSDVWLMCWRSWWMSLIGLRLHFIHIYKYSWRCHCRTQFSSNMFIASKLPNHSSIHPSVVRRIVHICLTLNVSHRFWHLKCVWRVCPLLCKRDWLEWLGVRLNEWIEYVYSLSLWSHLLNR